MNTKHRAIQLACLLTTGLFVGTSYAEHSWGSYHWARTTDHFTLLTINSMTSDWSDEFFNAVNETSTHSWSTSSVLTLQADDYLYNDDSRTRKRCSAVTGQMRVCNAEYGQNGWLGLASVYIDSQNHIVKGTAKMNDSYASYWAIEGEKNHVICQEIGHVLGLAHTSENGSSQQTCMDYSYDMGSQWPNAHDYEQLEAIYGHTDSYNSYSATGGGDGGTCTAPPGKGCNKSSAPDAASPPMGTRVHKGPRSEIWVAPGRDGGLWVHHVTTVPEGWTETTGQPTDSHTH